MEYYVYIYKDPITNDPFYVGKGKGDRYKAHLYETKENYKNKRKYNKIKSLKEQNLQPIIDFHSYYDNEDDAYDAEETLIKKYGRIDFDENGILTNIAINSKPSSTALKGKTYEEIYGVEGAKIRKMQTSKANKGKKLSDETKQKLRKINLGRKHTKETKRKISEAGKGHASWNKGKKQTEETKRKISETLKGKPTWNKGKFLGPRSDDIKQKISETLKGHRVSMETRQKISKKLKGKKRLTLPWNKGLTKKDYNE